MDRQSNQLKLDLNEEPDGLTLAETEGDNWLYDLFIATVEQKKGDEAEASPPS